MNSIKIDEHVLLDPLRTEDAAEIFHTINTQRSYLGPWLPFVALTQELSDTQAFVASVVDAPEESREPIFVIRYQGQFAGIVGFLNTDRQNRKTEIGYWLSEPFQKKGLMSRSVKALLQWAFVTMELNRVQIRCATGNTPSLNVPRRLGFHFEGIERAGELLSSGKYADLEVYSMLRDEFMAKDPSTDQ